MEKFKLNLFLINPAFLLKFKNALKIINFKFKNHAELYAFIDANFIIKSILKG